MNILAETSSDQKRAKKNFRKHALLKAKILETKSIIIGNKEYRIIGQQLISSPLFSHFEVVDQEGNRGNRSIEEKVYTYISMLQMINHFKQIKPWLKQQKNETDGASVQDDSVHHSVSIILHDSEHVLTLFNELEDKAASFVNEDIWNEKHFKELQPIWNAFWQTYEKRLEHLFNLHTHVFDSHLTKKTKKDFLNSVYKEVHFTMYLFKETIPLHDPFITDINDFITLNSQLGKITESPERQELIQKKERFSFHFFKTMLYALVLIQIVVAGLTIIGVLHLASVITTFILVLLVFYFGYINDRELLKTIETRLKSARRQQLNSAPLLRKKYKKEFTAYIKKEKRRKSNDKPYQFYVSIAKLPTWFMFFGITIFMLGLALFSVGNQSYALPLGYLVVGVVLSLIGVYLPKVSIGQRKIILEPGKMTIQKKVYQAGDFTKIRMNQSKQKMYLHITSIPDPMTFRIQKETKDDVHTNILKWCEQNYVTYEVKR